MRFRMNLHPTPFELIQMKKKDVEMRLYTPKRKEISIGDEIVFTNIDTLEQIMVTVVGLHHYSNFVELYNAYPKSRLGYEDNEEADPNDMLLYYSVDDIKKYGTLAIEIELIN